jgi:hypothetical protein
MNKKFKSNDRVQHLHTGELGTVLNNWTEFSPYYVSVVWVSS